MQYGIESYLYSQCDAKPRRAPQLTFEARSYFESLQFQKLWQKQKVFLLFLLENFYGK